MCSKYLETAENTSVIKSNTYRYKKDWKEKEQRVKTTSKMNRIIRSMEEDVQSTQEIAPIIHMAKALTYDANSDYSNTYINSSKWQMQMEAKQKPAIQVISDNPPLNPPPSPKLKPPTTNPHIKDMQWVEDVKTIQTMSYKK